MTLETKILRSPTANKPYTHSTIGGIIGAKRSCKSLLLAATIIHKLTQGENVWSNMSVKTGKTIMAWGADYAETNPLDADLLYSLDEELTEGMVALDEIGYSASSMDTQTTKSKLIAACIRQAGHRNLDFWYTAREFNWVDYRVRNETDVLIVINDLFYKPWGRCNSLLGGTVAHLLYYDVSGQMTGTAVGERIRGMSANALLSYPAYEYAYNNALFYGPPYHDCYDTREIIPIEEAFAGVKLNFKKTIIGDGDYNDNEGLKEKILQGIKDLIDMGITRISTSDFWDYLKNNQGVAGNVRVLGRLVPKWVKRIQPRNGDYQYGFESYAI